MRERERETERQTEREREWIKGVLVKYKINKIANSEEKGNIIQEEKEDERERDRERDRESGGEVQREGID